MRRMAVDVRSRGNADISKSVSAPDLSRHASVRVEPEAQRLGADEGDEIALPPPGRGFAQRRDQIVVGLRRVRRTGAVLHLAGDKDDGVAGDRELALAALAPEFEDDLAIVADVEVGTRFEPGCGARPASSPGRTEIVLGLRRRGAEERPPASNAATSLKCALSESRPLEISDPSVARAVLCDERGVDQTLATAKNSLAKKSPRACSRGDFAFEQRERRPIS